MKTIILGTTLSVLTLFGLGGVVHAQTSYGPGMMGQYPAAAATSTDSGDAAGAALWQKLSAGQVTCSSLSQSDFAALGDYFMGAMMGSYHDQADQYMSQSLGSQGDAQMHIAMGERLSGCNPAAAYPSDFSGFYPMMNGGGWGMMNGWYGGSRYGYGYGPMNWIPSVALWVFAVIGIVALVRWLVHGRQGSRTSRRILEERFARGDITQAEFDDMRAHIER